MPISERIIDLQKRWNGVTEVMASRRNPPVYSHPDAVFDMAVDLEATIGDLNDVADQLLSRTPKIAATVADLDSLPVGSLILELDSEKEKYAFPWVKVGVEGGDPMWSAPGDEQDYGAGEVGLPAYIMWMPAA